jgi:2-isopropylmalate synthase
MKLQIYDTTLRDGAQQEGVSFSVEDKLNIVSRLDKLGISFIEGGYPGSNSKDAEFFIRVKNLSLADTCIVAFSSTRHSHCKANEDIQLKALLNAGTEVVTIVGKSWDKQVTQVLETTLVENLNMITDTIEYLKENGLRVFFDAEHFFDGYKANREYAVNTIGAASKAGAECIILCDTNGGTLPDEVARVVKAVQEICSIPIGIHAHNDAELAVANSLAAVQAGASQIQGTINGYGERCGNANLCSIIPNLKLKMGINCISDEQLGRLSDISRNVSELANLPHVNTLPYVGPEAFAHKAGLHVSALMKCKDSYQHIDPILVGNQQRVIISELSGKSNILYKAKERGLPIPKGKETGKILSKIKILENQGFQYSSAEASFDLLLHRAQVEYIPPFELIDFMVIIEKHRRLSRINNHEELLSEATIKVKVGDRIEHTAAEGDGPINALDQALRKALIQFYPDLNSVELTDFKVRILDETAGTASMIRVLIESSDGKEHWKTVGSSSNLIEASWLALSDSIEYWLLKQKHHYK